MWLPAEVSGHTGCFSIRPIHMGSNQTHPHGFKHRHRFIVCTDCGDFERREFSISVGLIMAWHFQMSCIGIHLWGGGILLVSRGVKNVNSRLHQQHVLCCSVRSSRVELPQ